MGNALVPGQLAGTAEASTAVHGLTGRQQDACEKAHRRIMAVRQMVGRQTKLAEVRHLYGIGERTNPQLVEDVVHALRAILARVDAQPEEARAFGLTEAQIAGLRSVLDEVLAADAAQEKARAERPNTTRARDAAISRIRKCVAVIAAAGALEFADDDAKRVQSAALVSRGGRRPKAAEAEGAEAQPAAPVAAPATIADAHGDQ